MVRLKGITTIDKINEITKFQFLMVRLKASVSVVLNYIIVISIPYGAIKRQYFITARRWNFVISIPYGAIKSFLEVGMMGSPKPFQFLMVRLKVALHILCF